MPADTTAKPSLRQRALHEFQQYLILTAYLAVTFGAIILVKTAVLHTVGIAYSPYGFAIVKAAVLAKFIMIGRALRIDRGWSTHPLIWPTLHRTLVFLLFLIVLTIIEEVVVGLFHGHPAIATLAEFAGPKFAEFLAGIIVVMLTLIPLFAMETLNEALGEGRLARLFFTERRVSNEPTAKTR